MDSPAVKSGEKAASTVRDAAPTVRRSTGQNSLYTCCGCDYEKDVIQPSKAAAAAGRQNQINERPAISTASTPLKSKGSITTQSSIGNIVAPETSAIQDFLQKSYDFPIGLCKSMAIHAQSVPWRIVLVDCRYETPCFVSPLLYILSSHLTSHITPYLRTAVRKQRQPQ